VHLFDSHCHLDLPPLADDLAGVLERARAAGVTRMLVPGVVGPVTGALDGWLQPREGGPFEPGLEKGRIPPNGAPGDRPPPSGNPDVHPADLDGMLGRNQGSTVPGTSLAASSSADSPTLPPSSIPGNQGIRIVAAWGIHPGNTHEFGVEAVEPLFARCTYRPVAIGEVGLDQAAPAPIAHQVAIFAAQAVLARGAGLPLLIHLRGHWNLALDLLGNHASGVPWVMHNFSGSLEIARLFVRAGAFISFSGSLCRSNARKAPAIARDLPRDRVLVETDAPDLPPPGWGRPCNEPAALPAVLARLAEIRAEPVEELAKAVFRTAGTLFPTP